MTKFLTAEEFAAMPNDGRRTELVKGVIVEMPPTNFRHGVVCARIALRLGVYVEDHDLGWVLTNDAGVITTRDPDSVRGPDVAYFSYARVPKDQPPDGYPAVTPDLVFEVLSPSDRDAAVAAKVEEYMAAGVRVVCVADPESESVAVHTPGELPRRLSNGDDLTLHELFPDFSVPVRRLFA